MLCDYIWSQLYVKEQEIIVREFLYSGILRMNPLKRKSYDTYAYEMFTQ